MDWDCRWLPHWTPFFPPRLNGKKYQSFLDFDLPEPSEVVPVIERFHIWFMHDMTPPHLSQVVQQNYHYRWIGRQKSLTLFP